MVQQISKLNVCNYFNSCICSYLFIVYDGKINLITIHVQIRKTYFETYIRFKKSVKNRITSDLFIIITNRILIVSVPEDDNNTSSSFHHVFFCIDRYIQF